MADWVAELTAAIEKENEILDTLAELAESKTGALKAGDTVQIDSVVNREQPLVRQLDDLEVDRLRLLKNKGMQSMPLSQLAELAGEQAKPELLSYLDKMTTSAKRLKEANETNSIITRSRLEFYEFLSGAGAGKKNIYGNSGRVSGMNSKPGLFDTKI